MAGEWKEAFLGDAVTFSSGGTPAKEQASYWDGQVPWVSAKDMKSFYLRDAEDHISELAISESATKRVPPGTVLMLARGMTLLNDIPICVLEHSMTFNQDVKAVVAKPGVLQDFVPYLLLGHKQQLLSMVDLAGHGTGRLNSDELKALPILLPPLDEQQRIANFLAALDRRIELNRRMSETLEEMARALFKSWFVTFDPVRAKGDGRDTGLPKEIADLFPDSFEDSELGEIPKGWTVGRLDDVASAVRENVRHTEMRPGTPYIALEHMPQRSIALTNWGTAEAVESNKSRFERGQILFGKLRPYFHKVGVAPVSGVCSTDIVVVSPKQSDWFGFVLGHVSSGAFVDYASAGSTGTKMPRTSWSEMARYPIVLPPSSIAAAFTEAATVLVEKIISNVHESHSLESVRDALLPKLVAGEIGLDRRRLDAGAEA